MFGNTWEGAIYVGLVVAFSGFTRYTYVAENSQGLHHVWNKLRPKEWYITFTFLGQFVGLIIASHPPPPPSNVAKKLPYFFKHHSFDLLHHDANSEFNFKIISLQ